MPSTGLRDAMVSPRRNTIPTATLLISMTRLKRYTKLSILIFSFAVNAFGQNLYDLDHTKKYADFLFQSRQYKLAAMEFERLLFMEPENAGVKNQLVKSYRLSDQYAMGITRLKKWYPE